MYWIRVKRKPVKKALPNMVNSLFFGITKVFRGSEHVFKNIDTVSWKVLIIGVNRKIATE